MTPPRARQVPEGVTPAFPARSVGAGAAAGIRDRCRPPRMAGRARPPARLCRSRCAPSFPSPPLPPVESGEGEGE